MSELINNSAKQQDAKSAQENHLHFCSLTVNSPQKGIKKAIPFTITSQNKILQNKPNQGGERHVCWKLRIIAETS